MDRPQGTVVRFRATSSALVKADQNDGRRARRRVLNADIAASNDRRLTVNCVVRDMSDVGAA
jgi:hypothetical protein